jgi:hypothetical protein
MLQERLNGLTRYNIENVLDDDIDLDTVFEDFASRNLLVLNIIVIYYYELNICFKLTFIICTIYFNLYIKKLVQ